MEIYLYILLVWLYIFGASLLSIALGMPAKTFQQKVVMILILVVWFVAWPIALIVALFYPDE